MNFGPQVIIFEDEDEELLKGEFVRLMAKHRQKYSAYEVAQFVFRGLREPEGRAAQAASIWGSDLDIKEQIDEAVLRGSDNAKVDTREARLKTLKQIYDDINVSAKDRIAAVELAAKIEGEIVKLAESKNTNDNNNSPALMPFMFATYDDE